MSNAPKPRMLTRLIGRLDDIEQSSEWEYQFITDLAEGFESGAIERLSDKQFSKLVEISQRYA